MVRHGVAKKRRRNNKVKRSTPKHKALKVINAVPASIKESWDKSKSPADNLSSMGLDADPNLDVAGIGRKTRPKKGVVTHAAFLGMTIVPRDDFSEANPTAKRRLMSETDQAYARANIAKHGDDYEKMHMDIKTNAQQLTKTQLEKMCKKYIALPEEQRKL